MQIECPRCDKRVPAWAAYCRRCGMSLEQIVPLRVVSTARTTPPLTRLLGIMLVGCLVCMAALNSRSPYDHPRSGGYGGGGGGGGGGPVVAPFNPFGFVPGVQAPGVQAPGVQAPGVQAPGVQAPGVQAPPAWPQPYESPQPGRVYPGYHSGRDPYVPSYRGPYGRPYSPPYGNSYGVPSAPGAPRGPGR